MNKKKYRSFHPFMLIVGAFILITVSGCSHQTSNHQHTHSPLTSEPVITQTTARTSIIGLQARLPRKDELSQHINEVNMTQGMQPLVDHKTNKELFTKIKTLSKRYSRSDHQGTLAAKNLDFIVENKTGTTLYVTCFAYMRRRALRRWGWRKSPIYALNANQSVVIDIGIIEDAYDRKHTFGVLGVFDSHQEAKDSTYELLPDENKLDLDLLQALQGRKVTIEIEKYGFKKPFYDFDFLKIKGEQPRLGSLDYFVKNETGKKIYVCGFTYMKKAKGKWVAAIADKDDMAVWRYDKSPVLKLDPDQTGVITIDTNDAQRDREYMIAFLGIFNEHEQKMAEDSTYELLAPENKVHLGPLLSVSGKTIALEIEQYGLGNDIVDYVVKPAHQIDFTKIAS